MRVEGLVNLQVDGHKLHQRFVIVDGYVMRVFKEETHGCESTIEALSILDLRMVERVEPVDAANPTAERAVRIKGKLHGKKHGHAFTINHDTDHHKVPAWLLNHVCSAAPDHTVAATLRSFRSQEIVVRLMAQYSQQRARRAPSRPDARRHPAPKPKKKRVRPTDARSRACARPSQRARRSCRTRRGARPSTTARRRAAAASASRPTRPPPAQTAIARRAATATAAASAG